MHVIDGLGHGGGAEESLVATLPLLRDRGIDSAVVCLFDRPGWQDQLRAQGFSVTVLPPGNRRTRVRDLRHLIVREHPDLVHAVLIEAAITSRIASLRLTVPRVDSLVNTTYDPARRTAHRLSRMRLAQLRQVDALTSRWVPHFHVLTDAVAREATGVLRIPPERITKIPRGRSAASLGERSDGRRSRVRHELGLGESDRVLLNVGRHDPQKAKLELVRAFEQVATQIPDVILLIAGRDGSDTATLTQAVRDSPHGSQMRLLGHRDDVPDLLVAADVFVFPSLYEGFGGSLIEAMAMECPIIGSDAPAVAEVLDHGRLGVIVPRGDTRCLAEAMSDLLQRADLRADFAQRARRHFLEHYELNVIADATADFYRRVANQHRLPRPERPSRLSAPRRAERARRR